MSKGIDKHIDQLLVDFNSYLWEGKTRSFYGRVFRNERIADFGTRIAPEVWVTPNTYIEVLKSKKYDAQCFFDVQPNETINIDNHTADVWLCFMVNLAVLYPTLTRTEATEKVHTDVEVLLLNSNFIVEGLVRGFQGFTGYDWGEDRTTQSKVDMSPHYLFRFNLKINYQNSNC